KVADVVDLREREEVVPLQREGMLDEAADLERPLVERNVGLLAEVEHGPVLDLMLTNGQLRHPVAVARAAALGRATGELDIHRALVEANLPLNIFLPPRHQIIAGHMPILPVAAAPSRFEIGARHRGSVWPMTHDARTDRWTAARAARLAAADLRR